MTTFPWHELPACSAADAHRARQLRGLTRAAFDWKIALETSSKLLASEIDVRVIGAALQPCLPKPDVLLIEQRGQQAIALEAEPDLAAAALARILGRPVRLQDATTPLEPALRGALAALMLEVARTAARSSTWAAHVTAPSLLPARGLALDCAVILDAKRYRLKLWSAAAEGVEPYRDSIPARHRYPAQLTLAVPLVVGNATTAMGDLSQLAPGDVWLSRDGWWVDHNLRGKGMLCAPTADFGVAVDVWHDRIVLGTADTVLTAAQRSVMSSKSSDTQQDPLAQTLATLPIEVRVEIGAVSLPAADWAQLQPGDVIPCGPLQGPVRLRANGAIIAEGELVRVDDELGVRIISVRASTSST